METTRRAFLGTTSAALAWGCGARTAAPVARPGATMAAPGPARLRLDANENPYGPSPRAVAAAAAALSEACRYTDADDELTAALAARHGVAADQICLGTGSFAVLIAAATAALRGGGSTVVAHPAFGAVGEYASTLGPVTRVPLDARARHDLDAMARAIESSTKLVYVCNPNNPTGTVVPAGDVAAFCRRHAGRALVIVDEAYAEYVEGFTSADALVRDGLPIVVVKTFSKLYGLAGLRVGYAIAPRDVAAALRRARGGPDKVWIGVTGAAAALASLGDDAYVARVRREVGDVRARFAAALERLGLVPAASQTSFVYVRHPRPEALAAALRARGIQIAARTDIGGARITIGLPSEMTAVEEALAAVLPTLT